MHLLDDLSFTSKVAKRAQYEAFEFVIVPDGVRVRNCSHEKPAEHEYTVTVRDGRPTCCECPADQRFDGACKHRVAVAIRRPIVEAATTSQVRADGGTVQKDGESPADTDQPDDCECASLPNGFPCWECVRTGRRSL
ncbi:SWIM zinc finger family protein [Natronoarchaeum mannanilyticum]|uniref:SWIM zinc finger family protein n=1 Tax=Natronoarchaeum mannanilyticum TaxID=926360 RepID=UPI0031D91FF8